MWTGCGQLDENGVAEGKVFSTKKGTVVRPCFQKIKFFVQRGYARFFLENLKIGILFIKMTFYPLKKEHGERNKFFSLHF